MLMTYSWALLIIALFVAIIFVVSGSRAPSQYIGSQCNIVPTLPCIQSVISGYNSVNPITFTMAFNNNLGTAIQFPANAINVTATGLGSTGTSSYLGNCYPSFVTNGGEVICTVPISGSVEPAIGSQVTLPFTISYNICNGKTTGSCTASTYKTTGQAVQNLAQAGVSLYRLTLTTTFNSFININGVTYISGSNVLLSGSKYTVFALPVNTNYKFSAWSFTGNSLGSSISSTSAQNATLNLGSNVTLNANFIYVGPPTTTVPISTSTTTSTSTTSTSTSTTTSTTSTSTTSTSTTSTSTSSTSTTMIPPHLDTISFKGGTTTASNTQTTNAYTTNVASDFFILLFLNDGGSGTPTITNTNSISFTLKYGPIQGGAGAMWVYYAKPGAKIKGGTITVNELGATYTAVGLLAVVNANSFDTMGEYNAYSPSSSTVNTYVTTANSDEELFAVGSSGHSATPTWEGVKHLADWSNAYDNYGTANAITTTPLNNKDIGVTWGLSVGVMAFAVSP
ncbi:MAG: hypothetical protein KGH98_03985 [Candidatus Micrarchaeota archaeon]|nr:hypothetical protein [Candidatus Micrarchaeota archaeon]